MIKDSDPSNNIIPVNNWNDHFEWPPVGGMRHLVFHRKTNGFDKAFKKVGRCVLVDKVVFWECVDQLNSK